MNLLLIGLRGSGKSTVGRALAVKRGEVFVDMDERTLRVLGEQSVAEAWKKHGQEAFRRAESEALREALAGDSQVVALGGGTPTAPGAAEMIREQRRAGRARTVYMRCQPEELRARLTATGLGENRPSITGGDPLAEIDQVFAERDALYASLADMVIEGMTDIEAALKRLNAW